MVKDRARILESFILFNSAYTPLYFILFIRDFKDSWLDDLVKNVHLGNFWQYDYFELLNNGQLTFWIFLLSLACCLIVIPINKFKGEHEIKITQVRNKSSEIVNYTVPFMVSFFSFDVGQVRDLISLFLFLLLLFLLSLRTQSIFVNPVLSIFKYGLYEIDYVENNQNKTCVFITRISLERGEFYQCTSVSAYLKLITAKVEDV